jgi:hypothetical protein
VRGQFNNMLEALHSSMVLDYPSKGIKA